jgi:hypothetical protein
MKENIFDVLMYLFENYMDDDNEMLPGHTRDSGCSASDRLTPSTNVCTSVHVGVKWPENGGYPRECET